MLQPASCKLQLAGFLLLILTPYCCQHGPGEYKIVVCTLSARNYTAARVRRAGDATGERGDAGREALEAALDLVWQGSLRSSLHEPFPVRDG